MKVYTERSIIEKVNPAKAVQLPTDYDNECIDQGSNSVNRMDQQSISPVTTCKQEHNADYTTSSLPSDPASYAQRQDEIGDKILAALKNIKMIKSGELCEFLGFTRNEFNPVLSRLVKHGLVGRTDRWQYYLPTKSQNEIKNFSDYVAIAQDLEKKGLWRRAADAWLSAFDATASAELRTTAVSNREQCLKNVEQIKYEEEGYMSGSISETNMLGNKL